MATGTKLTVEKITIAKTTDTKIDRLIITGGKMAKVKKTLRQNERSCNNLALKYHSEKILYRLNNWAQKQHLKNGWIPFELADSWYTLGKKIKKNKL